MHELSVTNSICPASCIDSDNPKLTKFSFTFATVGIGVSFRSVYCIFCIAKETGLVPKISASLFKNFLTAFTSGGGTVWGGGNTNFKKIFKKNILAI